MAIRKRKGVYFVDFRYTDPITQERRRFRRTTGKGTTKKEATELEFRWRQEVLRPPAPARKRAAFSGFCKHYLDTHVRTNCKPSTVRGYEQHMRVHLVPFFGDADLRLIDAEQVARFGSFRWQGSQPRSAGFELAFRSGMSAAPDATWTSWTAAEPAIRNSSTSRRLPMPPMPMMGIPTAW